MAGHNQSCFNAGQDFCGVFWAFAIENAEFASDFCILNVQESPEMMLQCSWRRVLQYIKWT